MKATGCILLVMLLWICVLIPVSEALSTTRSTWTTPPPVLGPQFIYQPPSHVNFANTQTGRVECTAYGEPQPTIEWFAQNGSAVHTVDGLLTVLPNGTLIFPPFNVNNYTRLIHARVYRCKASNNAGAIISRSVRVNAVILQSYHVEVNDEHVMRGNTAVFKCLIPIHVKSYVKVTEWTRGTTVLSTGDKFSVLDNGELHVRRVRDDDVHAGYRCSTTHKLTGVIKPSNEARLFLEYAQDNAPDIISSTAMKSVAVGDRVELPCVSTAYPQPVPTWKRGRHTIVANDHYILLGGNLVIEGAMLEDEGRYTCKSQNDLGEASIQTVLTVNEPLSVYFDQQHQTIDVGMSANFNCSIHGHPISTISWLKNGVPIEESERIYTSENETSLIIDHVLREDKGMYQCFVSNNQETREATVQLSIGAALPVLLESFEEQTLQPGPDLQLTCVIVGNPIPNVTWTLDGLPVPQQSRFSVGDWINLDGDVISHVNITGIRVMDGGLWRCQATSEIGETFHEDRINIISLYKDDVVVARNPYVRPMPNVTAVAGRDTVIHCRVAGYPVDVIEWRKNGVLLPTNLRQHVFTNGTFIIESTEKGRDEGEYTCAARNPQGQGSKKKVFITVKVPPEITPFEFPEMLRQGERTQAPCVVSTGDMPITITWKKDGGPIPQGIGITITHTAGFSSTLSIGDVSPHHEGNYTCVVKNDAAQVTYTSELVVLVPPRFTDTPEDQTVVLNFPVTIPCSAAGTPTPIIQWKKAMGPGASNFVSLVSDPRFHIGQRGSLTILGSQEEDDGYYLCHISNDVGSDSKTAKLTVYIPAYFENPTEVIEVRKGRPATLTCDLRGHHLDPIDWKKNDFLYTSMSTTLYDITEEETSFSRSSVFEIHETRREDTANYTCEGKNPYGPVVVRTVLLIVQEAPETPSNLTALRTQSRGATISWKVEFNGNSDLTGYTLEYKNDSDPWQGGLPHVRVEPNETSYTITNLHPYYTYNVRIYAFNSIGVSQPSRDTLFTTRQEAPSGPPLNIELEATGSQSVEIRWRQPRADLQNGVLRGYYIGYKEFNSSLPYIYSHDNVDTNNIETYSLKTLKKFTKYSIVVQAFNDIGAGPRSEAKVVMTLEDVPSQPPLMVQATAHSSTSIMIVWSPPPLPSLNGILQGYKVIYKTVRADGDESGTFVQETKSLRVTIHGLEKFTNYSVEVLAYTRVGDGVRSEPIHVRTEQDVPEEPANIKAHAKSPTSIMLSWLAPLYPNGIIKKYTIYTRYKEGNREMTEELVLEPPPTILYHTITNLQTNYEYDFWVTASTIVGEGAPSRIATDILLDRVAARISSFPLVLTTPWKRDVELPCVAVGDPAPTVEWRKNRLVDPIEPTDHLQVFANGSLFITAAQSLDAGNYTCKAANRWGTDQVTIQLKVQVHRVVGSPPKAAHLSIGFLTATTIQVNWTCGSNGGSPIEGFTLHYKREHGTWKKVVVESSIRSYKFEELYCGTPYKFYLVASNEIGVGDSSSILETRTIGSAPTAPPSNQFVKEVNSTSVAVNLLAWKNGGCPIRSFTVQYQFNGQTGWNLVDDDVPASQDFFAIQDLRPATHYNLKVTAYNTAGPSAMEVSIATLKYDGSTIPPIIVHVESPQRTIMFYERPVIIIPLFLVLTAAVVAVMAFIFWWKNRERYKPKKANNLAAVSGQPESGSNGGFSRQGSFKRNYPDTANQAVTMTTAEQEPFLGTILNNSPSGDSSDSRPESERPRPWVYSPVQPDEQLPLQTAVAMDTDTPHLQPDMQHVLPSGTVPLSTFQSTNQNSEESIYPAVSDDCTSTNGLQLQEACYIPNNELPPSGGRLSPQNHTYSSLDDIGIVARPAVPKRPRELLVPPMASTYVKHKGTPPQEGQRHSVVSTGTTSSAHEELAEAFDNDSQLENETTPLSTPLSTPFLALADLSTQSDLDNGIRQFTASPPVPYVPERTDSQHKQQPSYVNSGNSGQPKKTNLSSRQSSDASEVDSLDQPQILYYKPQRHRPTRKQPRKGAHVIGRPVIKATRGPIRRHRGGDLTSSSSSNTSPIDDMTYTEGADTLSSPSEGYLSYQGDSRNGTLGSGLDSETEPLRSDHHINSPTESLNEPENSRKIQTPSTFKPRPSHSPKGPTYSTTQGGMGDAKKKVNPRLRQHSTGEPSDEKSPQQEPQEIEIHMLPEPTLRDNPRGYKDEYTIV
ncbi:cell adhesion molecule DSCAM-like [Glandiceps talaboti]